MNKFHKTWSAPDFDDTNWDNVKTKSHDKKLLRAPDASPIRRVEIVAVVEVLSSPSGKLILDFGKSWASEFSSWLTTSVTPEIYVFIFFSFPDSKLTSRHL